MSDSLDQLIHQAMFAQGEERKLARWQIWQQAVENRIIPASINDFYLAIGAGQVDRQLTVPAINLRGMTYDLARAILSVAKEKKVGALIFELARSEMGYTDQTPQEYVLALMAAALRVGWTGPLFVQGDHFQAKAAEPGVPLTGELDKLKSLAESAVKAGFYNIDIDMSTLVELDKATEAEQQVANIKYTLELAKHIRSLEPAGVTVSLGGEIGHIGGKNSTPDEFVAFMEGLSSGLSSGVVGISKISIQTGTFHGGKVNKDGSLQEMKVDFDLIKKVSQLARERYGVSGVVQHGASTLSDEIFAQFPAAGAVEIHLATGVQNLVMDHAAFPIDLLDKMYAWLDEHKQGERKPEQTDEQFHYKLRKKAWGEFKQQTWEIDEERKAELRQAVADRFSFFFDALRVTDTEELVQKYVRPAVASKTEADFEDEEKMETVLGLSD